MTVTAVGVVRVWGSHAATMLAPRDKLWSCHDVVAAEAFNMLELNDTDVLADYGCGDGRVLIQAAQATGCRCVGYEINAERAEAATTAVAAAGVDALVTIRAENALNAGFGEPSKVFLFLIKRGLRIMLPHLNAAAAARPDGMLVATVLYRFPPHVKPRTVKWVSVTEDLKMPVYLYHLPLAEAEAEAEAASDATSAAEGGDGSGGDGGGEGSGGSGGDGVAVAHPSV